MGLYKWLVAMVGAAIALMLLHEYTRFFSRWDDIESVLIWTAIFTYLIKRAIDGLRRLYAHFTAKPDDEQFAPEQKPENREDGTA